MSKKNLFEGIIMVRGKGTGFVSVPNEEEDIIIPSKDLSFAINGDLVEIELKNSVPGKRREGKVLRVIKAKHSEFVGSIDKKDAGYRLVPDNHRIHIRPVLPGAGVEHEKMKVVVRITTWKNPHVDPIGEITEILGPIGDHETEMQAIIRSGGISENFPEQISNAAHELYKNQKAIFEEALADPKRKDIRDTTAFTIDPADAKDFDDALSFRTITEGVYEIGIHIADVSHYVKEGDVIDMEARERGTSVYLVDRVIPMLPEVLSNDLCSLRPNEDRLAFSALFEIDTTGNISNEWYGQTVIHSDTRFSYEEAQEVLDKGLGAHHTELSVLMNIGRILRERRYKNGAIAFEQPEVKFELDEEKRPIAAYAKHRTETMLMIEDFMLLANKRVSEFINKLCNDNNRNPVFVYRIHDVPNSDRIEELAIFLRALGHELPIQKGLVKAQDINKLLKEIEGLPEENLVKTATIRSMAKAIYSTKNIGHFGLAFKYYTHFTSPIRRYPDLMVHRLLRRHLDGSSMSGKDSTKYEQLSIQSSEREMTAVRAERDSIKYKQVEFMLPHVGETFDGIVTGVSDWGVYVEEKNSKAEGMVRLATIKDDHYEHEASKYRVRGMKTGKMFTLGQEVRIKLVRADMDERILDYEFVHKSNK